MGGRMAGTFNDLPNLNQINCLRKIIFERKYTNDFCTVMITYQSGNKDSNIS